MKKNDRKNPKGKQNSLLFPKLNVVLQRQCKYSTKYCKVLHI